MILEIKSINFKFYSISEHPLKNGDINFFGFFSSNLFKSYGYLSQNQINTVEKEFKIKVSNKMEPFPKETVNFWTKTVALNNKKQFNVGFLYLIKDGNKSALNKIKKYPFLELVLSDQPEIFYGVVPKSFSYKKINQFRFSNFTFDAAFFKNGQEKNSNCYKLKDLKSSTEIAEYIFGTNFPVKSKKLIMTNILHNRWGDIVVNYQLIRIIDVLKKIFSIDFICYAIENHLDKILNCRFLKDIEYSGLHLEKNYYGPVKYLMQFSEEKTRFREMIRFNVPSHILNLFSQAMGEAFDTLKPDVSKESDALYFFNNLSRDFGKLKSPNFELKVIKEGSFKKEITALDNLSYEGFTYQVAQDYYTLIQWGSALRNCAGNFHSSSSYKSMLMVGIFKENKIIYLASIKGDSSYRRVDQLEGFKNSIPKDSLLKTLFAPFCEFLTKPDQNLKELQKKEPRSV